MKQTKKSRKQRTNNNTFIPRKYSQSFKVKKYSLMNGNVECRNNNIIKNGVVTNKARFIKSEIQINNHLTEVRNLTKKRLRKVKWKEDKRMKNEENIKTLQILKESEKKLIENNRNNNINQYLLDRNFKISMMDKVVDFIAENGKETIEIEEFESYLIEIKPLHSIFEIQTDNCIKFLQTSFSKYKNPINQTNDNLYEIIGEEVDYSSEIKEIFYISRPFLTCTTEDKCILNYKNYVNFKECVVEFSETKRKNYGNLKFCFFKKY